jgi:hypothetical protein
MQANAVPQVFDTAKSAAADLMETVNPDLVMVPFRPNHYLVAITGTAATSFSYNAAPENGDGSCSGLQVTVPAGINQGLVLKFWFYGTLLGLRWYPQYNSQDINFGVLIDGMPFDVTESDREGNSPQIGENQYWAFNNSTHNDLVATGLPPGKHLCEIHFPSNIAAGAGNTVWFLWGFVAERSAGYKEFPSLLESPSTVNTLTTSAVAVKNGYSNTLNIFRYFRKIIYTNTSVSSVTVTVQNGTGTIWQTVLAAAGSAGCSDTFDPGGNFVADTALKHLASAGSAVNATIYGGY